MSQLQSNPYKPPTNVDTEVQRSSVLKLIGQVCVCVYGFLFTLFCIAGTIDDIASREPILETAFWLAMSVLTCYGVFAFAFRRLRIPRLSPFWKSFGVALPFLTYLGAGWEIYTQPAMSPQEFIAVLTMFVVVTTPGLVFNWMLRHRMDRTEHDLR